MEDSGLIPTNPLRLEAIVLRILEDSGLIPTIPFWLEAIVLKFEDSGLILTNPPYKNSGPPEPLGDAFHLRGGAAPPISQVRRASPWLHPDGGCVGVAVAGGV